MSKISDYSFADKQFALDDAWEIQNKAEEKEEFQQIDLFRFLLSEEKEKGEVI